MIKLMILVLTISFSYASKKENSDSGRQPAVVEIFTKTKR